MNTLVPSKIAKYVFALIMVIFGIMHFLHAADMTGMVPSYMPMPSIWIYITGAAMVLYAVAVFMNHKMQKLAGYLLALLLVLYILLCHIPSMGTNPLAMIMIMKDLAMASAAIYIANDHPAGE